MPARDADARLVLLEADDTELRIVIFFGFRWRRWGGDSPTAAPATTASIGTTTALAIGHGCCRWCWCLVGPETRHHFRLGQTDTVCLFGVRALGRLLCLLESVRFGERGVFCSLCFRFRGLCGRDCLCLVSPLLGQNRLKLGRFRTRTLLLFGMGEAALLLGVRRS